MSVTKQLIDVAVGRTPADVVLKNAQVVNVFTRQIVKADVALCGSYIAGVGSYSGKQEIDCTGKTLCPGFIDAHMHIESSMVLPAQLASAIVPSGTTTVIADPHEIVNVCGGAGVEFLLQQTENIPLTAYIMLPSSVPATPFETNGADFTAQDMPALLHHPRVLGLGEVMCFPAVINGETHILDKLAATKDKVADGHAPNLSGKALQAYVCAGIATEHECITFSEAAEKVQAGLKILIREGSAAHNLEAIIKGWLQSDIPAENFMFCTDDKHLDDIYREGHISYNVRRAIALGVDPVTAVCMASWFAACAYHLPHVGAIAAGYQADILVLSDLQTVQIEAVYKGGKRVTSNLFDSTHFPLDAKVLHTVNIGALKLADIQLRAAEQNHVMQIVPHQILTQHLIEPIPKENGFFKPNAVYNKLCVIERHRGSGNVAVCALKGFGIKGGAIATTVAHDSHNLIVAGDNDSDILVAIETLKQTQGGYVLVKAGKVVNTLPLPVAGLISTADAAKVQAKATEMLDYAYEMGVAKTSDPFITLSFLALPVIPSLRLTDKGLVDVDRFELITP
ncbi:MAG: adenine deaminase [Oscillospiraceae bacterium]|nr:adenine deaminase [Oscillospiraceae bacterium]